MVAPKMHGELQSRTEAALYGGSTGTSATVGSQRRALRRFLGRSVDGYFAILASQPKRARVPIRLAVSLQRAVTELLFTRRVRDQPLLAPSSHRAAVNAANQCKPTSRRAGSSRARRAALSG